MHTPPNPTPGHSEWCDRADHHARTTTAGEEWQGCGSAPVRLALGEVTLTANLLQLEPGDRPADVFVEVSRDGRVIPASFHLAATDAAKVCVWVAELLGQAGVSAEPSVA